MERSTLDADLVAEHASEDRCRVPHGEVRCHPKRELTGDFNAAAPAEGLSAPLKRIPDAVRRELHQALDALIDQLRKSASKATAIAIAPGSATPRSASART